MSVISSRFLMKILDSVNAYCVPIEAENAIYVVDANGFIGLNVTSKFNYTSSSYNYAIKVSGANFAGLGLGKVTFTEIADNWIGGRKYKTVMIGGKEWLAENLDYKFDGLNIIDSYHNQPSGNKACYCNFDEETYGENGNKYGLLYQINTIQYMKSHANELFPGWHVPDSQEWKNLITAINNSVSYEEAGTMLKSTTGWNSHTSSGQTYDGNGTDDFGFNVVPSGYLGSNFNELGYYAYYFSGYVNSSSRYGTVCFSYRRDFTIDNDSHYLSPGCYVAVRLVKNTH